MATAVTLTLRQSLPETNRFDPEKKALSSALIGGLVGAVIGIFLPISTAKVALAGAIAAGAFSWVDNRLSRKKTA